MQSLLTGQNCIETLHTRTGEVRIPAPAYMCSKAESTRLSGPLVTQRDATKVGFLLESRTIVLMILKDFTHPWNYLNVVDTKSYSLEVRMIAFRGTEEMDSKTRTKV